VVVFKRVGVKNRKPRFVSYGSWMRFVLCSGAEHLSLLRGPCYGIYRLAVTPGEGETGDPIEEVLGRLFLSRKWFRSPKTSTLSCVGGRLQRRSTGCL